MDATLFNQVAGTAKSIPARNVRGAGNNRNAGGRPVAGAIRTIDVRRSRQQDRRLRLVPGTGWKTICPEPVIKATRNMKQTGAHRKSCLTAFNAMASPCEFNEKGAILHPTC